MTSQNGPDAGDVTVAIVTSSHPSAALVAGLLREVGWYAEQVEVDAVADEGSQRWDLVVICATEITSNVLVTTAHAAQNPDTRVFVITEESEPQQIRDILRSGADDHLVYPFSSEECIARMQSLMARARIVGDRRRQGRMTFDFSARVISAGPTYVALTAREWDVLIGLLEAEGEPLNAAQLGHAATSNSWFSEQALASIIGRIRRKMKRANFHAITIETVRSHGYAARFRRGTDSYDAAAKIFDSRISR